MSNIETLEEATERYSLYSSKVGFIEGAKWQKEQDKNKFSEEEVKNIVYDFWNHTLEESVYDTNMNLYFEKWFKQFKKK
jgi:predicted choloylglycine hydrolase